MNIQVLTPEFQEWAALAAVALAVASLARGAFRRHFARPLSAAFLKRGRVSLAMRIRQTEVACGSECGACPPKSKA